MKIEELKKQAKEDFASLYGRFYAISISSSGYNLQGDFSIMKGFEPDIRVKFKVNEAGYCEYTDYIDDKTPLIITLT